MPEIVHIQVDCACGARYQVRLDRVKTRQPIECVSCGGRVAVTPHADMIDTITQFNSLAVQIEKRFTLKDKIAVPLPEETVQALALQPPS